MKHFASFRFATTPSMTALRKVTATIIDKSAAIQHLCLQPFSAKLQKRVASMEEHSTLKLLKSNSQDSHRLLFDENHLHSEQELSLPLAFKNCRNHEM